MDRIFKRGEEIARRAQREKARQAAGRLSEVLGDVTVESDGSRITASGRDLVRRWLADSRLRFLGSELR